MVAQILNILLGIWLMAAPAVLNYHGPAANNSHIVGPIVASFSIIALSGTTRGVAHFNILLGIWLLLAPWVLGYDENTLIFHDMSTGILVILFSFFKRKAPHQFGGGWKSIWRSHRTN